MSPIYPFYLKGSLHSTVICPLLPLLNKRSAQLNCNMSPPTLHPLIPQSSAPLNCHLSLCAPSPSKLSTTQLSYVPHLPSVPSKVTTTQPSYGHPQTLLPQESASPNCLLPPSTPSQSKVSKTQLSYAPPPPSSPSKISTTQLS